VPDDEERLLLTPTERRVLAAPDWVARAASAAAADAEQRWMLRLPRDVRRSFVREVLERGEGRRSAQERWLLLAGDDVRRSYVDEVLGEG
jgi:uncharacterized protein CbrC (UPF0167 family)